MRGGRRRAGRAQRPGAPATTRTHASEGREAGEAARPVKKPPPPPPARQRPGGRLSRAAGAGPGQSMADARPDGSPHAPLPLPARPSRRGPGVVGGRERTWVRPLRARSLARSLGYACADGRAGERRRSRVQSRPARPPPACLCGRAPTASRTGPGAPAEGARAAPREGGRGGGGGKLRAQSPVRGGAGRGRSAILSPYLRPRGRAHHPPSRRGGGRAPSWPPPSRSLNPPETRGTITAWPPLPLRSTRDARGGKGKWETLLPANRCSRGLTKMAAAVSAATTASTSTTHYRYRRRGPSSRERQ